MIPVLDHLDQVSIFGRSSVAFFLILGLDWAFSAVHAYDEWRGEEAPLWRVFGAIVGLLVPNWAGFFFFTVVLTLALWGAGLAGICGCLPLVGHSLPATVGALGVITDILERPLACSGCGVDRHCGGRGCFRAGVAGDAGVQGDSALLGARALDSMAAAAGVDERVTSRLRGAYWALADTRRDAP